MVVYVGANLYAKVVMIRDVVNPKDSTKD